MLPRVRVGTGQKEDPIRPLAGRRPDLLPVDNPLIAVEHRLAPQVAEVGAGIGLAVALTPDVVAVDDPGNELLLLLLGAPVDQRVAHHLDAEGVVGATRGNPGPGELLGDDHDLEGRQPGSSVLGGPAEGEQLVVAQDLAPFEPEGAAVFEGQRADALPLRREVFGEEGLDLLAVGLGFGGIGRVHPGNLPAGSTAAKGHPDPPTGP